MSPESSGGEDALSYYICKFVIPLQEQRKRRKKESSQPYSVKTSSLSIASWRASFQQGQIKKAGKFQQGKQVGSINFKKDSLLEEQEVSSPAWPTASLQGR